MTGYPPIPEGPITEPPSGYVPEVSQYVREVGQLRALHDVLADAGVELGPYDERTLDWLAGCDWPTVATIASLIKRARAAGRSDGCPCLPHPL